MSGLEVLESRSPKKVAAVKSEVEVVHVVKA
jgi:hypothetical protein